MDEYVATIPIIRFKPHKVKSRNMLDKMLNRYFDKVVESEFNQQRMRSEQWRQNRTMFDSYMNLSPVERRRVSVSDMRGYQMQRIDNENVLLYSFEDNVVYNAKIDKQFNKIIVQSVNHKLSDMEKRAIFDNPFGYEPVSPYRIRYQRSQVGDAQIVNITGDLGTSINEMKNAADAITVAAQQMGDSINTVTQQNAAIINDFAGLRDDVTAQGDPNRDVLLWNDDNTTAYKRGVTHTTKRGSTKYRDLVAEGRVERDRWLIKPEQQPLNVTNQIVQQMDVKPIIEKLDEVITVMNSFDIQVNLVNIYRVVTQVAERINFLEDAEKGYPKMLELLNGVNDKLQNANQEIKLLNDRYAELARSIATGDDKLIQSIGDLVNQQKAVIENSNQYLQQVEARLQGNENKPDPPAIADIVAMIPRQSEMRIDELLEFMKNQYNDFLKQWLERNSFIQQFVSAELGKAYEAINKWLVESFNRFTPLLQNVSNELQTTNQNLIALGNAVENEGKATRHQLSDEGKATRQQLLDGTNALGKEIETTNKHLLALENGQTQTGNLLTDVANGQTQLGNMLTNGFYNNQMVQQQIMDQNMQMNDRMNQAYRRIMNQPQIQAVIYLGDRQPEIVNTQGFTPQAIEQVNQVAALIDEGNNEDNATADEIEKEMIRNDFIAFSSLLARNVNNPNFTQFANDVGFSRLFKAYRERNEDEYLMNFFIQVANSNNLTPQYLADVKKYIRFHIVATGTYEEYLQRTYNTIQDMFNAEGASH